MLGDWRRILEGMFERAFFRLAGIDPSSEQKLVRLYPSSPPLQPSRRISALRDPASQGSMPLKSTRFWRRGAGPRIKTPR